MQTKVSPLLANGLLGLLAGGVATIVVTTLTVTTLAVSSLTIGGGAAIDKHVRTTAVINVNSMGRGQATSSVISVSGATTSDVCEVRVIAGDYLSTTSTGLVDCAFTASDVATLVFRNATSVASFDAGASTFSISGTSY